MRQSETEKAQNIQQNFSALSLSMKNNLNGNEQKKKLKQPSTYFTSYLCNQRSPFLFLHFVFPILFTLHLMSTRMHAIELTLAFQHTHKFCKNFTSTKYCTGKKMMPHSNIFSGEKAKKIMHIVFICGHFASHIIYEFGIFFLRRTLTNILIFAFDWTAKKALLFSFYQNFKPC